jgi:hypothetical protein
MIRKFYSNKHNGLTLSIFPILGKKITNTLIHRKKIAEKNYQVINPGH